MNIEYKTDFIPAAADAAALYDEAGLKRPTADIERMDTLFRNSNLVITAWHHTRMVGIARSLTDFRWCCYLSDLAVHKDYQRMGIGKKLISLTKESVGDESMVLLLSVDTALEYYPRAGMTKVDNGFILFRDK